MIRYYVIRYRNVAPLCPLKNDTVRTPGRTKTTLPRWLYVSVEIGRLTRNNPSIASTLDIMAEIVINTHC